MTTIWHRLIPYKEWKTTFIGKQSIEAYMYCKDIAIWQREKRLEWQILQHNWYRDVKIQAEKIRRQQK